MHSALGSNCEGVEYSLTYLSFASFHEPHNLVRLIYEKNSYHSIFDIAPYGPENTVIVQL